MTVLPRRATLYLFILATVVLVVSGISGEASAQVYQGTLVSSSLPFPVSVTVTLQPGGPALYTVSAFGIVIDAGLVVANVAGSSVTGFIQTFTPGIRQCFFTGVVNGPSATLTLDSPSCGGSGTVSLTRT